MCIKVVAYCWEHALHYIVQSYSFVVERRSCYWYKDKHYVVDEERRHNYQGSSFKLVVSAAEVEQDRKSVV